MDIFNPEVSFVTKGLKGKSILLYGTNRTGKTYNATKAEKSVTLCFEQGLGALTNVRHFKIKKWSDWTGFVKDLTKPANEAKAHEMYETIVIDTIDPMFTLAAEYMCTTYGVISIDRDTSGKKGYGIWKEYRDEIAKWVNLLTNSGFTVVFVAHEDTRKLLDDKGQEYEKIFPRGDKRSVDLLCDLCDFIAYAHLQPNDENGNEVKSTLYLKGTTAFHAGSRFKYMPLKIDEWNMTKLEQAISEAIEKEENESGVVAKDYETVEKEEKAKTAAEKKALKPIATLIEEIGMKVKAMIEKTGSKAIYDEILTNDVGNAEFSAQNATEKNREQLDIILACLVEKGF